MSEAPLPPAVAGAAMRELLARDLMPGWAVGPWCADLEQAAGDHEPPERLCWAADDVLILAPWRADGEHWAGFVIAERSAIGQRRTCWSEAGESVELQVPQSIGAGGGYVFARAGVRLPIVGRPGVGPENSGQHFPRD